MVSDGVVAGRRACLGRGRTRPAPRSVPVQGRQRARAVVRRRRGAGRGGGGAAASGGDAGGGGAMPGGARMTDGGRAPPALCPHSLTWSLFMSLLTHRVIFLCADAYHFISWDLPGDVLAAPASALCGWNGVILPSLSLCLPGYPVVCPRHIHVYSPFSIFPVA